MRLSIIIPVYNVEQYLEKCISSLEKLVANNVEFIFVNDGSTDNSLAEINRLKHKLANVQIINQVNQGLSVARNNGIKSASGNYLILLDSDDFLDAEKFVSLLDFTEKANLDIAHFELNFVNSNYEITGEMQLNSVTHNEIITGELALIQGYQPSSACLFLYKRQFLEDSNLYFYPGITQEDVEFTIRLLIAAKRVYFSKERIYFYLRREDSLSMATNKEKHKKYLFDSILVAEKIKENIKQTNSIELKKAIEKNYNSVIWNLLLRFVVKTNETDFPFIKSCIKELKTKKLYPINGSLKTNFQNFSKHVFNIESLFLLIIKFKLK